MSTQRVRVGVIGAGTFAEECHIPGIQMHPRGEVVALCARNITRVQKLANTFQVPDVYTDYHELIARSDIDAVTIATPDALHCPIALEALSAGKHVFCEKPLAMNSTEAKQMADAAAHAQRVSMVSFTFRYSRALQRLKQLLHEGTIGTPLSVTLQVHWGAIGYPGPALAWYDQAALSSSGTWADGASHLFDALAYILAPVQEVCAQMMIAPREHGIAQPETIDLATCLGRLRIPSGQPGHGYADREPGMVHVSILTSRIDHGPDDITVVGTRGMATIALTRGLHEHFRLLLEDGQWQDLPLSQDAYTDVPLALPRMMTAFIEAIERGQLGPDDPSFQAGLYTQQAIDAAISSARTSQWTTVGSM